MLILPRIFRDFHISHYIYIDMHPIFTRENTRKYISVKISVSEVQHSTTKHDLFHESQESEVPAPTHCPGRGAIHEVSTIAYAVGTKKRRCEIPG